MKRKIEIEIESVNEETFKQLTKDFERYLYPFQGKKVKIKIDVREVED